MAEVLITLGVIGIVAAMTLPGMLGRYQEKVTITRLKQTYSILSQAVSMAISEYGTIDNWCVISQGYDACSNIMNERIGKHVKKVINCNGVSSLWRKACFNDSYGNRFNSNKFYPVGFKRRSFVMSNGVSVYIGAGNGDGYSGEWCKEIVRSSYKPGNGYQQTCGYIVVDTNAQGGPNVDGRDLFSFKLYQDGMVPKGKEIDTVWVESFEEQCLGKRYSNSSCACTAWVLYNENMDYLHCNDLSWKGKRSCGK